jgi:ELWxxDGT repeat protein
MRTSTAFLVLVLLQAAAPAEAYWIRDCRYHRNFAGQTSTVADINPGPADATDMVFGFAHRNGRMAVYAGALYFQANNGQAGSELWRLQGGSPTMVSDLVAGTDGSTPHSFVVFQNKLYFAATTPGTGEELFRFDGTAIAVAADITPGTEGGEITALVQYKSALYFTRSTAAGQKVWRFDGTNAQVVPAISNVEDGDLYESPFVVFNGKLYFVKRGGLPDHFQLWAYDGSSAVKIKTLTEPGDIVEYSFDLGVYQGSLYFGVVAGPSLSNKDELWKYSGTGVPAKVATLGNASSFTQPDNFTVFKNKLYFGANGKLYRTDGTTITDLGAGPGGPPYAAEQMSPFPSVDRLFLTGFYDSWTSREPYLFDGGQTALLKDIMPNDADPYAGSFPTTAVAFGDDLYFYAKDLAHGRELWRVTGEQGPLMIDCDIVVAPIWVDKRLWVIRDPEVVVSTWIVVPEAQPRLISREVVRASRTKEIRLRVLSADTRHQPLPEGFALATLVFNRATGAILDRGFDVVGSPPARVKQALRHAASAAVAKRTLKDVTAEVVSKY